MRTRARPVSMSVAEPVTSPAAPRKWSFIVAPGEGMEQRGLERPRPDVERPRPGLERPCPPVERFLPGVERFRPGVERPRPRVEKYRPGVERARSGVERYRPGGERGLGCDRWSGLESLDGPWGGGVE